MRFSVDVWVKASLIGEKNEKFNLIILQDSSGALGSDDVAFKSFRIKICCIYLTKNTVKT